MSAMQVVSQLISLSELLGASPTPRFAVPIYQRLYVWGDDQIRTLLEDLVNAYRQEKEIFFLGGTLVVERQGAHGAYLELIDGQQRFTTLWMLSAILQRALEPFLSVTTADQVRPRLEFAIRPEVNRFLLRQVEGATGTESTEEIAATSRMRDAMALMQSFLSDPEQGIADPAGLADFIFNKVKMVLTTVPSKTDLNELFEIINNRGVQLQHHEILKARMLKGLTDEERARYAMLWDACADMGNYVERNLRDLAKVKISDLFDPEAAKTDREKLASASEVLSCLRALEQSGTAERQSLAEILSRPPEADSKGASQKQDASEKEDRVRSIIGFPVFLQHTLRIWLHEKRVEGQYEQYEDLPNISDRKLIDLFEKHFFAKSKNASEDVRSFIGLLWELRYLFDKRVIKWVDRGEVEAHLICGLRRSESGNSTSLTRDHEEAGVTRGLSLLQSMLYHSQQITTLYWLTPFLAHIWKHRGTDTACYRYLRHLDNQLLCTGDERHLIERTREFLTDGERPDRPYVVERILQEPLGVGFPHYWFYKLEFILWFRGPEARGVTEEQQKSLWESFRFTAKTSVEHISPQTRQAVDLHAFSPAMLDRFGNLALVSRSVNSEYGNLPFNEKRERFRSRNWQKLDSLKMALIYGHSTWGDAEAERHEREMIAIFTDYLFRNGAQSPEE
jgi:hypothetical protein